MPEANVHTEQALQLLGHFNAFLQHWTVHFRWQAQPKEQRIDLHIQVDQFFQLHFYCTERPILEIKCHFEQLNWLQQPDLKQLCYMLMRSSLQHGWLYDQLMVILYRHAIASAYIGRRDYYELIYKDLMLLQTRQNNAALLLGQPTHHIDPTLLKRMKYLDSFSPALQQAWQLLQNNAYAFLSQLKTAVAYMQSDLPVSWYHVRYGSFDLKHYYQMSALWRPHLASLLAWCQESDNKLYWFLLTHDPAGVQNQNYFGYANIMQLQRGGVPLFEYKAQARRLFQLPIQLFSYIMHSAFYEVEKVAWWPALFLRWVLQPEVLDVMQKLSTQQFDRMQRGLSMLWIGFNRHSDDLQLRYLPNYCFALNAVWQDYAFERFESSECMDFIFGRQIHNHLYSNEPNIATVGPHTTFKSLLQHSTVWHRQSRLLSAAQFPFDYAPFNAEVGMAQFELIADSAQLQQAAKELQNCLLSFAERIFNRQYFAFRVQGDDDQAALGVRYDAYYSVYEFDQCYGIKNQPVSADLKRCARRFVDYLNANDAELWLPNPNLATESTTTKANAS